MPDIKILLFIGFIVYQIIAFIAKNKAKKEADQPVASVPQTTTSLEDILQRMNPQNTTPKERPLQKQPVILYDQVEEEKPKNVQKKFKDIKSIESQIGSTVNYEQTKPIFSAEDQKPFNEYGTVPKSKSKYAKLMKNPQTFRDAFVINEIMNPKYL